MSFGKQVKIPERFDEAFLAWFRQVTEQAWASYKPKTFNDYVASRVGGVDWQRGTRWVGGLSDDHIAAIQKKWSLRFPPDYRLFLQTLHATERPMMGAGFVDDAMEPSSRPGFYNWLTGEAAIQDALDSMFERLSFDVEHNVLWLPRWGAKPDSPDARREQLRVQLAAAPTLIPLFGHRFLLADPCQAGNPVLSVYQSDIIVYGDDLRQYLVNELRDLIGVATDHQTRFDITMIPFWGEVAEGGS